jgi:hypothetical protein
VTQEEEKRKIMMKKETEELLFVGKDMSHDSDFRIDMRAKEIGDD